MQFPRTAQPWLAASTDETRPVLTLLYLDAEKELLYATDSYRLLRLPVEVEDNDVSGYVTAECLKAATKLGKTVDPIVFCGEDTLRLIDGTTYKRPPLTTGQFPNVTQLWPDYADAPDTFTCGLSPELLTKTAKAMGVGAKDHLSVTIFTALRPFILKGGDGEAMLMPVRVTGADGKKAQDTLHASPNDDTRVRHLRIVVENGTVVEVQGDAETVEVVDNDLDGKVTSITAKRAA